MNVNISGSAVISYTCRVYGDNDTIYIITAAFVSEKIKPNTTRTQQPEFGEFRYAATADGAPVNVIFQRSVTRPLAGVLVCVL